MKMRRRRWVFRLIAAAAIMILAVAMLAIANTFGWAGHVSWSQLGAFNAGAFEAQLKTALPRGTPKKDVLAYLTREKIPFSYFTDDEKSIRAYARGAAPRKLIVFDGDLSIHIDFDKDEKVEDVEFYSQYK